MGGTQSNHSHKLLLTQSADDEVQHEELWTRLRAGPQLLSAPREKVPLSRRTIIGDGLAAIRHFNAVFAAAAATKSNPGPSGDLRSSKVGSHPTAVHCQQPSSPGSPPSGQTVEAHHPSPSHRLTRLQNSSSAVSRFRERLPANYVAAVLEGRPV